MSRCTHTGGWGPLPVPAPQRASTCSDSGRVEPQGGKLCSARRTRCLSFSCLLQRRRTRPLTSFMTAACSRSRCARRSLLQACTTSRVAAANSSFTTLSTRRPWTASRASEWATREMPSLEGEGRQGEARGEEERATQSYCICSLLD